ncbi:14812_t:CDS:2, partial [Gigaspora margarita]
AGLRGHQFELIVATAIKIWQQEGYDKSECAHLVAHMRLFCEKKPGFDLPYCFETDTPLLWWQTNYKGSKSIGRLAIKLFSITPHSADCERTFSSLGWLYGKRRQQLSLSRIQAMAQVRSYYISNIKKELAFYGKKSSLDDLQKQVVSATFLTEYNNLEIVERFDIENIVCLKDEIFQDNESDSDHEESSYDSPNESDNESIVSNKTGQGVFDFDPMDLAAQRWGVQYSNDHKPNPI